MRRCRNAPSRSSCACASTVNRVHGIASSRALGIGLLVNSQTPKVFLDALGSLFDLVNRSPDPARQRAQRKIAVEIVVSTGILCADCNRPFPARTPWLARSFDSATGRATQANNCNNPPFRLDFLELARRSRADFDIGRPRMAAEVAESLRLATRGFRLFHFFILRCHG